MKHNLLLLLAGAIQIAISNNQPAISLVVLQAFTYATTIWFEINGKTFLLPSKSLGSSSPFEIGTVLEEKTV